MSALLAPGDVALVPSPAYQPLAALPAASGATVETYEYTCGSGFGYALDIAALRDRIERTRVTLLVLNTPHNPTGDVIDESSLRALLTACRRRGTRVLVDEVFNGVWLDGTPPVPSALTLDDSAVVIGSFSKVYALSGLRVGWLAGPAADIAAARAIRHYTTIAPPLLVQAIATTAMSHRDAVLQRTRSIVARNRAVAIEWLQRHRDFFEWNAPRGGLVLLLRLRMAISADALCHDLARRQQVFIVPCDSAFGMDRVLRLGLGIAPPVLEEGLARFSAYLKSPTPE
jgi:aspartate/methionine/tyrosine aminotransferase